MSSIAKQRFKRFKSIKRGYYSLWIVVALFILSLAAELLANSRALIVKYDGDYYFPTYGKVISGKDFGLDYPYETNYRELKQKFKIDKLNSSKSNNSKADNSKNANWKSSNWVLLPLIPYNALESDLSTTEFAPTAPNFTKKHFLGTDNAGRDVLVRLIYGFRIAFLFALMLTVIQFFVGVILGSIMGYRGKFTDIIGQRFLEIWASVPTLYIIMIMAAVIQPGFWTLLGIMSIFGWMGMTEMIRTSVFREKARDYVLAARAIGASHSRILFIHILPNTIAVIVTFLPFTLAAGIGSLTALDYLGFGLPAPAPSWGELLQQGIERLDKPWIVLSTVCVLSFVLVLFAFIGEAVREAFDSKRFVVYE